ncbi:O-antigen/teichoic acid export membrane protein [Nocardiopsis arvandica]|uniref:O-antigen/teichoic acid export membrane protein n=1 Tax=Nocardiopsis sinuspersici TaxID=501010 RepID=A0A7Y9XBP7_9ACTN|nr:hypothetical protein [Nocardiopsis sinuspersici]NYH52836.1 O-antigen/teichoic acid export membrane protein [Nocardiopsis sinuspersici]
MAETVPLRLPRATVFATVCTGVSSAGHVLAAGHAVPPLGLAAGFVLVLAVAHGLFRSEQRLGPLVCTTLWCQVALHLLFAVASPGGAVPHAAGSGVGPGMLLAHALAGVVCAWWLRQGERAALALAGLVRSLLHRLLLLGAEPAPVPRPVPAGDLPRTPLRQSARLLFLRHVRVLRGPPATFPV